MATRKYPRVYRMLKAYGFSPAKALEIIIDCKRRSYYAISVLRIAFESR